MTDTAEEDVMGAGAAKEDVVVTTTGELLVVVSEGAAKELLNVTLGLSSEEESCLRAKDELNDAD